MIVLVVAVLLLSGCVEGVYMSQEEYAAREAQMQHQFRQIQDQAAEAWAMRQRLVKECGK